MSTRGVPHAGAPDRLPARLEAVVARGFRAIKLGWRPFGRVDRRMDEQLVKTARQAAGAEVRARYAIARTLFRSLPERPEGAPGVLRRQGTSP